MRIPAPRCADDMAPPSGWKLLEQDLEEIPCDPIFAVGGVKNAIHVLGLAAFGYVLQLLKIEDRNVLARRHYHDPYGCGNGRERDRSYRRRNNLGTSKMAGVAFGGVLVPEG